jgi:hypothetical protein
MLYLDISPGLPRACRDVDLETLVYRVLSDVELPAISGGNYKRRLKALGTCRSRTPPFHMFRRAI